MPPRREDRPLNSFRNILQLEQARKFDDKAVIGGLDAFISQWQTKLRAHFSAAAANKLFNRPYSQMSPAQRAHWVESCLSHLNSPPAIEPSFPARSVIPAESLSSCPDTGAGIQSPPFPRRGDPRAPSPHQPHHPSVTPAKKPSPPKPPLLPDPEALQKPVTTLRGVDTKTAEKLARLHVHTVHDLLYHFPRYHKDYSRRFKIADLKIGQEATVIATVRESFRTKLGAKGRPATRAAVYDETGNLSVVWFGNTFLARQLKSGRKVALSGKVDAFGGAPVMENPEYDIINNNTPLINTARLLPAHPLTRTLHPRTFRRIIWNALRIWSPSIQDFLPQDTLSRLPLMSLPKAVVHAHFPKSPDDYEEARSRLAFDELLLLQISVLQRRRQWKDAARGASINAAGSAVQAFLDALPFTLTGAQQRCLQETLADMAGGVPSMNRLLQGEVGSGKTVVAVAALLAVASMGFQGTIMVPTEVLAEQHFKTVCQLMGRLHNPIQEDNLMAASLDPQSPPICVGLVTGSTRKRLRDTLQQRAADGNLDVIIGTHILIQQTMQIPNLALSVVDEQHRFGVMQRAALRGKSDTTPHVLIMSATPIPRTLALTLYGDLDISTIDEMPPGRTPIVTRQVPPDKRTLAYDFVRGQVRKGRQAFIIFPLIEESELTEAKAAAQEYERLSQHIFPDLRVGLLHGRLPARQKNAVMTAFHNRDLDILVSTPVVEVGIDVPNASVMMVESADRFGLAQLHQFRGRVGRGPHKSFCLLLAEDPSDYARQRLEAIEKYNDGFKLAEVDLQLRGPGDLFGTRQSGLPTLKMARLADRDVLINARNEAARILHRDPHLTHPDHQPLANELNRYQTPATAEVA